MFTQVNVPCAVVGNSGSLLQAKFGAAIDSHALVVRMNHAPQGGRNQEAVGCRVTHRWLNLMWAKRYTSGSLNCTVSKCRYGKHLAYINKDYMYLDQNIRP